MRRVRGPAHLRDPDLPPAAVGPFRQVRNLPQVADELLVVQMAAVGVNREDVERSAQFHRLADEAAVDARRRTAQHLGLRIALLDGCIGPFEHFRVHLARSLPEEDIRLVPDLPIVDVVAVVFHDRGDVAAVVVDPFRRVGLRPAGPEGEYSVDGDAVVFGGRNHLVVKGPVEFSLGRLDAVPAEILARPLHPGRGSHLGRALHLAQTRRPVAVAIEVQPHAEGRRRIRTPPPSRPVRWGP